MAKTEVILPAMGEGIIEATIMRWLVEPGGRVEIDEPLVEIATDKVDSELPSPASGVLGKIIYREGEMPKIGEVIAVIITSEDEEIKVGVDNMDPTNIGLEEKGTPELTSDSTGITVIEESHERSAPDINTNGGSNLSGFYFSPLIRSLAQQRGISIGELKRIKGTGAGGRVTRDDLYEYIKHGRPYHTNNDKGFVSTPEPDTPGIDDYKPNPGEKVVKMDRTRKLIAEHMVRSKRVAPHVTSMIEVDISHIVTWRESVKESFRKEYKSPLTYTAIIVEAVAKSLKDFPAINVSVHNDNIIYKPNKNIGIATALPNGNLIVPVIHKADHLNLQSIAQKIFDLSVRAREGLLEPHEIKGGTFTVTNMGQFGNITGTPIINQPEVAILAVGTIKKAPYVVNTEGENAIGIRDIIILSLTYDHRVVDGALGGSFLKDIGKNLEEFLTDS